MGLHCSGDASQSKTCGLPMATGSLTFNAMTFPIQKGTVPVNVDIDLHAGLPSSLARTTTTATATDQNGATIFCMQIKSAPTLGANYAPSNHTGAAAAAVGSIVV